MRFNAKKKLKEIEIIVPGKCRSECNRYVGLCRENITCVNRYRYLVLHIAMTLQLCACEVIYVILDLHFVQSENSCRQVLCSSTLVNSAIFIEPH